MESRRTMWPFSTTILQAFTFHLQYGQRMMVRGKYYNLVVLCMVGLLLLVTNRYGSPISIMVGGPASRSRYDWNKVMSVSHEHPLAQLVHTQAAILVHTTEDSCHKWSEAFPDIPIVLVGVTQRADTGGRNQSRRCVYIHSVVGAWGKLEATNLKHTEVIVAQDGHSATDCVQNLFKKVSNPSRYSVVYKNSKESIYLTKRHFGCGGIENSPNVSSPYSLCKSADRPGPIISVPSGVRPCDKIHPSMILGEGQYALSQMQCAWIPSSAFWTVPFLTRPPGPDQIALSMITENLLWYTGYNVQVAAPILTERSHGQNALKSIAVMKAIAPHLSRVSCAYSTFSSCFAKLSASMVTGGQLTESDLTEFRTWISNIEHSNYHLPTTKAVAGLECFNRTLHSFLSIRDAKLTRSVNLEQRREIQAHECPNNTKTHNFAEPWIRYRNVLFIVTYNRPGHYDTIPYFETLYRQFFPHILYCGPGKPDLNDKTLRHVSFSYLSYAQTPDTKRHGSLHYECLIQASRMGYDVSGYFQSSDDIFLNMHRVRHFDTDKAWYYQFNNLVRVHTFEHTACQNIYCSEDTLNNKFWHQFRNETASSITELNSLQSPAAKRCNRNREKLYGGIDWHVRVISDTSYTPARYVDDVASVLEVFLRHELYLEIALPTTLYCIIPEDQFDHIYMDLHNLATPWDSPYNHNVLKPIFPDLVILSILERRDLFWYNPRALPFMYITPQFLPGVAIFHGYKLSMVQDHVPGHLKLFCDVINYFGDPNGNANKYITKYTREEADAMKELQKSTENLPVKPNTKVIPARKEPEVRVNRILRKPSETIASGKPKSKNASEENRLPTEKKQKLEKKGDTHQIEHTAKT